VVAGKFTHAFYYRREKIFSDKAAIYNLVMKIASIPCFDLMQLGM